MSSTSPSLEPGALARMQSEIAAAVLRAGAAELDQDPQASLQFLAAARDGHTATSLLLRRAALSARKAGHTWEAVGLVLGISKQAAQQRFAEDEETVMKVDSTEPQQLVRRAILLNEMDIMEQEGRKGWKLVAVGVLQLRFERTAVRWEYVRRVEPGPSDRRAMAAQGWERVGSSTLWHYFRRPVEALDGADEPAAPDPA